MLSEKAKAIGAAHVLPGGGLTLRQALVRAAMRAFLRDGFTAFTDSGVAEDGRRIVRMADAVLEAMAQE